MGGVPLPVLSCQGCGVCCHLQVRPPYLPQELDVVPPELVREIEARFGPGDAGSEVAGPCMWLTAEGQCGHYADRPAVCREFELGGEDCLALRAERGIGGAAGPAAKAGAGSARQADFRVKP